MYKELEGRGAAEPGATNHEGRNTMSRFQVKKVAVLDFFAAASRPAA